MKRALFEQFKDINRELWLILSMLVVALLLNSLVALHRMVLGFYVLPTLFSAYYYGKRHATLTAIASICLVVLVVQFNAGLFAQDAGVAAAPNKWFDITVWGGTLVVIAYAMGTLYDRKEANMLELRQTYHGILLILRQFISNDHYTQNHSYRVSIYATSVAATLGMDANRLEDVRAAALLHDIGKLKISRELLYKAASLTKEEFEEMQQHIERGGEILESVGGSLRRVIPLVLAHHEKFDGSGYHAVPGDKIPIEAKVIAVADAYDALTSDRPYRKAVSAFEAKEIITKRSGIDFDPIVVDAFVKAFMRGQMEIPEVLV